MSPVTEHRDLRVGLLGYGFGGRVFHAPFLETTPGLTLAAVVTADPARAAAARAAHPQAQVVAHAEELWASAENLDAVVISTPNVTHVPLATEAVRRGLATVVDKPLAGTAASARRLVADAQAAGVPLTVYQNRRFDDDFLTVQRVLAGGDLGTINRFESRFERFQPAVSAGWKESAAPEAGGGAAFDFGAHLIDQAMLAFGPVATVFAELRVRRPGAEAVDDAFVALTHEGGTTSHLWMSLVAADRGPRFRVLGSAGAFSVWDLDPQEDALIAGARPGGPGWPDWEAPHPSMQAIRRPVVTVGDEARPVQLEAGSYATFYQRFERAVRLGEPLPVDAADSVAVLDVLEAASRSAATGSATPPAMGR